MYMILYGLGVVMSIWVLNEFGVLNFNVVWWVVVVLFCLVVLEGLVVVIFLFFVWMWWGWFFIFDVEVVNYVF